MGMIYLITGEIQSGKTSLCLEILEMAREEGVQLGGVVSPGVFHAEEKIAIDLQDVRSGERRRLAERLEGEKAEIATRRWAFLPETVAWGNQNLDQAVPCQLLMIDELGPLEFQRGQGLVNGFKAIESGEYRAALLVIRPSLLDEALSRWEVKGVIDLDDPDELHRSVRELFGFLVNSSQQ